MRDTAQTYTPKEKEGVLELVKRTISEQPDREPLRIVEQLVEIVLNELKERTCDISALVSPERMEVTLHHNGKPIDGRIIHVMRNFTERLEYDTYGNNAWELVICRDIPPLFVTRR